jgi:hypothetical protein
VGLVGPSNRLRPTHVDWQQLHRPRMGQKESDVRRFTALRDVGLFRPPLSAVRIFKCASCRPMRSPACGRRCR